MATANMASTTAKHSAQASVLNSFLLFAAAALDLNVAFWVLAVTNFVLMHAVWLLQLVGRRSWGAVDFSLAKWPLIAFAGLSNAALLLWEERLLSVFPA